MSDAVIGSLIGASVALIGLIIAKEGKTSEFRQQWIDGLRNDVATALSLLMHIGPEQDKQAQDVKDANECLARIQLRLNTEEAEGKALVDALNALKLHAENLNPMTGEFAKDACNKAQIILKHEWRRVKRGEWKYILILSFASLCAILSLSILIYSWMKSHGVLFC